MENLTPQFFDVLILVVVVIGLVWAGIRLRNDFTRPLPPLKPYQQPRRPETKPTKENPS